MKAVVIRAPGGPEVLELRDVPAPVPARHEVRVRVRATAVNRADLLQRLGGYPAPADAPADIPGLEFSGEVEALGDGVRGLVVGDRVFGLVGGGAYAEYVVVHERAVAKVPAALDHVAAAAVPEAFLTAWDAIVTQGQLAAGDTLLVSAVGSGVGTAAVQLARAIGATAIGSARTSDKLRSARALGMAEGVLVQNARFADDVLRLTGGRGADVILELVGGAYLAEDLKALAPQGRLVLVGLVAGARVEVDLGLVLRKRITIQGTVMRARPIEEKIAVARVLAQRIAPLFERGALQAVVHEVLPLADAPKAHELVASNATFGKVVLRVD